MREAVASPQAGVMIRLAGMFSVEQDDTQLVGRLISGKARTLLALLTVERRRVVPIHRVEEVLWAGNPPKQPANNIATLVSRLRRILGHRAITGGRDGYRLGTTPAVRVDVDEAAALIAEAEGRLAADEPTVAGVAATRALVLLNSGSVLEGEPRAHWAEAAWREVSDQVRRARHVAAAAALQSAEPAVARRVAEAAVLADRFDEAAYRLLMRAHTAAGEPARALLLYERLRDALVNELGTDPAPETRALHLAILRERVPKSTSDPNTLRAPVPASRSMLVGRDAEMAHVARAWSAATAGQPAVLVVAGESGIGKSRLAAEAARHVMSTGGTVLQAACYEAERSLFLQPFVDALTPHVTRLAPPVLREIAGEQASVLATLVPNVARVLGSSPDERYPAEFGRSRVYQAVTAFLRGLAAQTPVLLVLDDLHNAGEPAVELLHYLARRAAPSRLLCIATICTEVSEEVFQSLDGVAQWLSLGALPPAAVTKLAAATGKDASAAEIFQRTRGHTLSVVETLRGQATDDSGVPESLRLAVLRRVRRVGEQIERLLRAAAVLGSTFDPLVLAALVDLTPNEVAYHCEQALTARLLVVSGRRYAFANELIRQALHVTTPEPTRRIHQRRASELLHGQDESLSAFTPFFGFDLKGT
ncbi:AAA family ATPase [Streptosporangium sp. NPDC087985]|uniref:AAA family ATPase n=1 Tax=Streptosporangium sp. NPDC087985 TaxID=3366196 RepID=UPI0038216E1B